MRRRWLLRIYLGNARKSGKVTRKWRRIMDQDTSKNQEKSSTVDDLISKIELGVSSAAGRAQMETYLFSSLGKEVRNIAECDPEFNVLLDIRARIRALMLLAQ